MAKKSPSRRKHVPQRTCVVCREKTDKRQLTRIVRTTEGRVGVDKSGKKNGRGAYICSKVRCWETAVSSNILNNALKTELSKEDKEGIWQQKPSQID